MEILTIPCLKDNFSYLLICEKSLEAAVVDPSEADPIKKIVLEKQVRLTTIFNTHHHWDHVGGNKELITENPDLLIFGHESDRGRIPGQNVFLEKGEDIYFGHEKGFFIHNPGHTSGAITYVFGETVFTGDTLFAAGCGRIFEGTPEQMYDSINDKIGQFPNEYKIYFGHEYTENNLNFAKSVEPYNSSILKKLTRVKLLRSKGRFTTPTTLEEERETNPFMRCNSSEIQQTIKFKDPKNDLSEIEVFKTLRKLKDFF
tara:strand:+ start:860 stop:1633 length:774 start_codon:yes stop_codon:yes gene_type:complete